VPRPLKLLIKIFLSAGLIWYAFSNVDVGAAMTHLRGIPSPVVVVTLALLFLGFSIAALRLRMLLHILGVGCTLIKAIEVVLIGAFFGQVLISFVGGDAMRIWRMVEAKTPLGLAAKGVLFDRVAGFSGLITIILFSLPRLLEVITHPTMRVGLIAALLVAIAGILALFFTSLMPVALRRWKVFQWIAELSQIAFTILRSKSGLLLLVALSVGIHMLNVLAIYLIARGLEMEVSIMTMVVLLPPVLLLSLLPISVAGWGVREGAMVVALNLVGVPSYQSLALSICFGLCVLAISLPGGVLWFVSRGKTPADDDAALGLRTKKQ
jgi:uncharacterized membrane protein YbhN (UPF0104 family)